MSFGKKKQFASTSIVIVVLKCLIASVWDFRNPRVLAKVFSIVLLSTYMIYTYNTYFMVYLKKKVIN